MLKNITSNVLILCMALSTLAVSAGSSHAESMMWTFNNTSNKEVHITLYSQSRSNMAWPGGDKIYFVDPLSEVNLSISCEYAEKICYGAWIKGHKLNYWGVGYDDRNGCEDCCAVCGISDDPGFNLEE